MVTKSVKYTLIFMTAIAFVLTACYEKFDIDSYKPAFTIGGFSAVDEIEPNSVLSYFSFDEDLTDTKTGEEASNAGTTLVNGFKGKALSLNVTNKAYVTYDAADVLDQMGSFTISFWVNPTFVDANGDNGIDGILGLVNISRPDDFWGYLDWFVENGSNPNAAKIVVHLVNSGTGDTWMTVENYKGLFGGWTNHTLTYDASSSVLTYYINGSVAKTATTNWDGPISFDGHGPMVFGTVHFQTTPTLSNHGSEPWASWLTGNMDEIRIYSKALTPEQVNALVVLQGKGK
ncbi:MAG TPA: LamG-like jellyroll fold domain-containing protein [Chryseosolibacter sp.]|nr:LamG-like jellyroll fold domain-containing protein [Chryseosolibacter sp.]